MKRKRLTPIQKDCLWDYRQCARYLDLAEITVRKKVQAGELPHIKLGRAKQSPVRFFPAEIEAYLKKQNGGLNDNK